MYVETAWRYLISNLHDRCHISRHCLNLSSFILLVVSFSNLDDLSETSTDIFETPGMIFGCGVYGLEYRPSASSKQFMFVNAEANLAIVVL